MSSSMLSHWSKQAEIVSLEKSTSKGFPIQPINLCVSKCVSFEGAENREENSSNSTRNINVPSLHTHRQNYNISDPAQTKPLMAK